MYREAVMLLILLLLNQDIVTSHILTTTRELSVATCMKTLTEAVTEMCIKYGENSGTYLAFHHITRLRFVDFTIISHNSRVSGEPLLYSQYYSFLTSGT